MDRRWGSGGCIPPRGCVFLLRFRRVVLELMCRHWVTTGAIFGTVVVPVCTHVAPRA